MKQSDLSALGKSRLHFIHMKHILLSLILVGFFACCLAGLAQTTSPASDAAAVSSAAAKDAAPPAAEAPAPAAPQVAANDAAPPAAAAGNPPAANPPAAEAPAAAKTGSAAQPGTVIPLIVMDDVPLTDAIRNLARQAGINYMLDPKIGFGQVGPDGKATAQPNVSIRWENISAEQALTALLNNYTLQLTEDPKSKIARITTKDPAALPPLSTKIIQLKYASPSNVVASVTATLTDKRSKVMPDVRTSQLVVVATEQEQVDVEQLIDRLDTQTKQVLIETRLIETTVNPSTKKGVDWSGTLANQHVTFGNGFMTGESTTTIPGTPTTTTTTLPGGRTVSSTTAPASSTASTLTSILGGGGFSYNTLSGVTPGIGFLNAEGVRATLSFLNNYAESKVLSSPRTVTLDNEEARIEVGTMFPIVNTTAGTANTTGGSSVTYSNLTVSLKVTPRISANDFVNLKVTPNVTRLGPLVGSTVGGVNNAVYSFYTRQIETRVMIPSGNTLVMGGLIQDEVNKSNIKVPLLGDIPLLGGLFRVDSKDRNKGNLIVFITPTIIQDTDFQPTKSTYLKTPVPTKDDVDEDWSAWDSGKPKDWSKPKPVYDDSLGQAEPSSSADTSAIK
jgi:type II secretory pathway component GspD/PulD (secretin)